MVRECWKNVGRMLENYQEKTPEFSYLSTSLAHVRLLASVDTLASREGGAAE